MNSGVLYHIQPHPAVTLMSENILIYNIVLYKQNMWQTGFHNVLYQLNENIYVGFIARTYYFSLTKFYK